MHKVNNSSGSRKVRQKLLMLPSHIMNRTETHKLIFRSKLQSFTLIKLRNYSSDAQR